MITSKSHSDQTVALLGSLFAGAVVAPTDPDMDLSDTEWFVTKLNPKMIFCDVRCLGALQKTTRKQKLDCVFIIFGKFKKKNAENLHAFSTFQVRKKMKQYAFQNC